MESIDAQLDSPMMATIAALREKGCVRKSVYSSILYDQTNAGPMARGYLLVL